MGPWVLAAVLGPPAFGAEPSEAETGDTSEPEVKWRMAGLPYLSGNAIDGLGAGIAGEAFLRPVTQDYGYTLKLTPYWYASFNWNFLAWGLKLQDYRRTTKLIGHATYRSWDNMRYAGVGGAEVRHDWGDRETGNDLFGGHGTITLERDFDGLGGFVGTYVRAVHVEPATGGLLEAEAPLGAAGGAMYADALVGISLDTTDRWPLPSRGVVAEVDVRVGGSLVEGTLEPLAGLHAEMIRWVPLVEDDLVLGLRLVGDHTVGRRPFFEMETMGGRFRDEVGFDQTLSGYGPQRSRGDGVAALMVETRARLFGVGFLDGDLLLSLFAEEAFLFDGVAPGPPLPSVGGGPELTAWGGMQVRPFVSFGWWEQDGVRRPNPQLGISMRDPL